MLYDWQEPQARHLLEVLQRHNVALDASDTGTGKTFVACQVAKDYAHRPLVVCPKSVVTAWRETLELFGVEPLGVLNVEKLKTGKTEWVTKKNRGRLMTDWAWVKENLNFVIWDEVHQAGGEESQNSKIFALLKPYKIPVLALSATVADTPLRLRALGYHMGFHNFVNFKSWCLKQGCYPSPFAVGKLEFPKGKSRIPALRRIHSSMFPEFGGRLKIEDLKEFPDCVLQADEYDMAESPEIQRAYDELEDQLNSAKKNKESPLVLMNRARQSVEYLKVPMLEEQTRDLVDGGKSVVVFFSYREPAETFLSRIRSRKIPAGFIYGGQTQTERDTQIRDFQADKTRVVVTMIQAGGVGISLHDLNGDYPRVSLINPPFSVVQLKQALGRIWRAGAKTKAIQKIVFAAGTVEVEACRAIRRKLGNLNLLNDGDLVAGLSFTEETK